MTLVLDIHWMSSSTINIRLLWVKESGAALWKQRRLRCHSKLFMTIPRSRSGRYFGASRGMSMEEQFQRMSAKVFWHVFLTSRAAWIMVCMSSRLLRHSWAWEDTMPGSSLQWWVWLMCKDAGACDSDLQGGKQKELVSLHYTIHNIFIVVMMQWCDDFFTTFFCLFYELWSDHVCGNKSAWREFKFPRCVIDLSFLCTHISSLYFSSQPLQF